MKFDMDPFIVTRPDTRLKMFLVTQSKSDSVRYIPCESVQAENGRKVEAVIC